MTSATDPLAHATTAPPDSRPSAGRADRAPRWSLPALLAIVLLAAVLYSWNLSGSSLNTFYSGAVWAGTKSWKAWFFGSLDPGNFLTVDKPPFALMVMGLSCRLLGFGTWQMMAPTIAVALATIWILHTSVKRVWGHGAATVAALVLALTPITVAIDRDNNPDTLLVFLMVSGAALALRATRDDRLLPLLGAAACFGLAFNTKLLAGYIALPAVFVVYLYASKSPWLKRAVNLLLAAVVLAVSSFWWALAVSLVPASDRPYIGGSTDGTAWNLIMGYDGLGRVLGGEGNGGGGGGGANFSGTAGLGRLFNDILGGQISWLLPFSAIALIGGLVLCGRAPRTDLRRMALVLWGGWTVLHYVIFATAQGTMHPYYTTALAPGIAALCGGGGVMLLNAFRTDRRWAWVLPLAFAVTAVWAIVLLRRASGWHTWLWPAVGLLTAAGITGMLLSRNRARLLAASLAAAIVAAVAGPAAYSWSVPSGSGGGMGGVNPTAGPSTGGGFGGGPGGGRGGLPGGAQRNGKVSEAGGMPGSGNGEMPSGGLPSGGAGGRNGQLPGSGAASGSAGATGGTPPGGTGGMGGAGASGGMGGAGGTARAGGSGGSGGSEGATAGRGGGFGGGPGGMGGGTSAALIAYLKKHQDGATWLLAVSNSQSAAQLELSAREPVISMWGFTGSDDAMTVAKLKELVEKGELHYIQLGGGTMGGGPGGGNSASSAVTSWVRKHGTKVKASAYSKSATSASSSTDQSTIYRLDPSDVS